MTTLALIFLLQCTPDTVIHSYYREMFPYNKTDTFIVDESDKYHNKGDTIMRHYWPAGYYFKDEKFYMRKDSWPEYHMTKDSVIKVPGSDTTVEDVIVVTCDGKLLKAKEYCTTFEGHAWPVKYETLDTKQQIHNICQVEEINLNWINEKTQRKNYPGLK